MDCCATITYNIDDEDINPDEEVKTMNLEAKGNDAIIIGNSNPVRYASFQITVNPRISAIDET